MEPRAPRTNIIQRIVQAAKRHPKRVMAIFLILVSLMGLFFVEVVRENLGLEERPVVLGVTFSKPYAEDLGLDWKEAYTAVLDDLQVRAIRIPAYWNEIEPEPGKFNFTDVDLQVDEAAKRGAKIILAVGRKLPRWPECHMPDWAKDLPESIVQTKTLSMLESVINHYKKNPAIAAWQVENEPLFRFGVCPPPDRSFLKHEIAVVRALDGRPIIVTESGELSTWVNAAGLADILGISTYRIVWSKRVGYFFWPVTPRYYSRRADAISALVDRVIITELQAEPWVTAPITSLDIAEQLRLMSPARLQDNVIFARRAGFPEVYLWGVEWWYWLKKQGYPEMWETAGKLIIASVKETDRRIGR